MATHPGSIRRHGRGFEVRLCVAGRRHSYTVRCEDRREAQQWAKQKEAELERQADRHGPERLTPVRMSELLTQFERDELPAKAPGTIGAYGDSLKALRCYFLDVVGDPRVDRLTPGGVRAFLAWRRTHRLRYETQPDGTVVRGTVPGSCAARTISKDRSVLHQLLGLAQDCGYCEGNACTRRTAVARGTAREPVILSDAQYEALLGACGDPMLKLYLLTVGESGARNESEVLQLQWPDVDFAQGDLVVGAHRRTKTGKPRYVPMTARLAEAMRAHFAQHRLSGRSDWVFHHTTTRRHYQEGARIHSMHRAVQTAARKAKLPAGWRCYDLRHRRITLWRLEGKPDSIVAEAVGHASLAMTKHYTHVQRAHLKALVQEQPKAQAAQA
jgi:integrase